MPVVTLETLTDDTYIHVPKWERFQHYRDRKPIWIKVYTDLLKNPDYVGLSLASRGLLLTIWLAHSQEGGRPLKVKVMRNLERTRGLALQLISLNEAGFITLSASRLLAQEVEIEKEGSKGPKEERSLHARALAFATDWTGTSSVEFDEGLDTLERELHARLPSSERERLWDIAFRRHHE